MTASVTGLCNKVLNSADKPEQLSYGIQYLVDYESDAFKIAYLFRNNKHGVQVRWFENVNKFAVTVFNEYAAINGIDRS
jgi:hypothetical protein